MWRAPVEGARDPPWRERFWCWGRLTTILARNELGPKSLAVHTSGVGRSRRSRTAWDGRERTFDVGYSQSVRGK